MRRPATFAVLCFGALSVLRADENQFQAELRGEGDRFAASCVHPAGSVFGAIGGCGQLLFTDSPFHIAAGSLAPDNGFGLGIALTTHYTPNEDWRMFFDFDAVASPKKSWRAGGYMTAVMIRHPKIVGGALRHGQRLRKRQARRSQRCPRFTSTHRPHR